MKQEIEHAELRDIFIGKRLGYGIHRTVYEVPTDKSLVLKVATDAPEINFLEMEIWRMVKDTEIAKWFAPCELISDYGVFLLQKKATRRGHGEYPKMIPSFFGDCKYDNFGWIGKQFVCVDYAGYIASSMSHKWNGKMKKADWWEV